MSILNIAKLLLINEGIEKKQLGFSKLKTHLKFLVIERLRQWHGTEPKKVRIYGLNSQNYGLIPSKPTRTILLPIYSALSGKFGFLYIEIIDC
jgi:hypothetical protein